MLIHSQGRLLVGLTFFAVTSAIGELPAQTATCIAQLAWVTDFAARNYAGYRDKVTPATRPAYDSIVATLSIEAKAAESDAACDVMLRRWVGFFKDSHLTVGRSVSTSGAAPTPNPPADSVRARFASWPRRSVDEASLRQILSARATDPIEGIWHSADGAYRVGVLLSTDF